MPAAIEMGPHPAGAAFYCPCGRIYLKYRALVSHKARNAACDVASRARSDRIDAECREMTRQRHGRELWKTRKADDIEELRRRELEAVACAVAARSQPKKRGAARKAASDMGVAA